MKYNNPYAEIRKVPLDFQGIKSSAYSVQIQNKQNWNEVGVVSSKYLLIPNDEVRELADDIVQESTLDWSPLKTFFDGRRYFYGLQCKSIQKDVAKDDPVGIGLGFWNSYDGSTALSFKLFIIRLACTNGMLTKDYFHNFRFKHDKSSEGYEKQFEQAVSIINNCGDKAEDVIRRMSNLTKNPLINTYDLKGLRDNIPNIPTGIWGKMVDRYLDEYQSNMDNHWGFLNAATDILWHNEKPTMASFQQNQYITDSLLTNCGVAA
tara:strand:+ start:101 stop:889 length:789 start_codon:yes stop_codon:yes gene_type:complete